MGLGLGFFRLLERGVSAAFKTTPMGTPNTEPQECRTIIVGGGHVLTIFSKVPCGVPSKAGSLGVWGYWALATPRGGSQKYVGQHGTVVFSDMPTQPPAKALKPLIAHSSLQAC